MNRRRFSQIIFLAAAVLVSAAVFSLVYARLRESRRTTRFRDDLERIDVALLQSEDTPGRIRGLLQNASRAAESASDYLSVLKRAYQHDMGIAFELAQVAFEEYPGNQAIAALTVHTAMRTGAIDRAASIAESNLSGFPATKAEAYLRGGLLWREAESESGVEAVTRVIESDDPNDYLLAAEITGKSEYLVDAALLSAGEGGLDRALDLIDGVPSSQAQWLGLLLAFDARDADSFNDYLAALASRRGLDLEARLLFADLALLRGDREQALAAYSDAGAHPVGAANAALLERADDAGRAAELLEDAAGTFPENPRVLADHVRVLTSLGETDRARAALSEYRLRLPEDGTLAALELALDRTPTSPPERVLYRYWRLRGAVVDPDPLSRYIAWFLFGLRDRETVTEIVEDETARDRPWARIYRSAYLASDGRLSEALDLLAGVDDPHAGFNRGVIQATRGRHEAALDALRAAERVLEESARITGRGVEDDPLLSALFYRRALSLAALGRDGEAVRAARRSIEIDPTRADARQLLASLES